MTICVETLASLMAADSSLMSKIITEDAYPNDAAYLRQRFIDRFRYRMIGSCNSEEWIQVVTDTADGMAWVWTQVFDGVRDKALGDMTDRSYTVETSSESEHLPQTVSSTVKFLDNRSATTQKGTHNDVTNMRGVRDLLADLRDPYDEWVREFDQYFLNRLADCPCDEDW